jgi:hypothetical protein
MSAHRRALSCAGARDRYFVPVELDEPEPVAPGDVVAAPDPVAELEPEVVVSVVDRGVVVDGDVVVGGEADGVRSPGRSLTRSVPVSVHAVASVAINASAEKPASVRFMKRTLLWCSALWAPCRAPIQPNCNGSAVDVPGAVLVYFP